MIITIILFLKSKDYFCSWVKVVFLNSSLSREWQTAKQQLDVVLLFSPNYDITQVSFCVCVWKHASTSDFILQYRDTTRDKLIREERVILIRLKVKY